jgi:hypothetical protein
MSVACISLVSFSPESLSFCISSVAFFVLCLCRKKGYFTTRRVLIYLIRPHKNMDEKEGGKLDGQIVHFSSHQKDVMGNNRDSVLLPCFFFSKNLSFTSSTSLTIPPDIPLIPFRLITCRHTQCIFARGSRPGTFYIHHALVIPPCSYGFLYFSAGKIS